jgi:hypothetical protein
MHNQYIYSVTNGDETAYYDDERDALVELGRLVQRMVDGQFLTDAHAFRHEIVPSRICDVLNGGGESLLGERGRNAFLISSRTVTDKRVINNSQWPEF